MNIKLNSTDLAAAMGQGSLRRSEDGMTYLKKTELKSPPANEAAVAAILESMQMHAEFDSVGGKGVVPRQLLDQSGMAVGDNCGVVDGSGGNVIVSSKVEVSEKADVTDDVLKEDWGEREFGVVIEGAEGIEDGEGIGLSRCGRNDFGGFLSVRMTTLFVIIMCCYRFCIWPSKIFSHLS